VGVGKEVQGWEETVGMGRGVVVEEVENQKRWMDPQEEMQLHSMR
jgi:hypothetical protein